MTAAAAYWPAARRLEVYGAFPADPDLQERGRGDGVGDRYRRLQWSRISGMRRTPV